VAAVPPQHQRRSMRDGLQDFIEAESTILRVFLFTGFGH
jgi:hypothetical protein